MSRVLAAVLLALPAMAAQPRDMKVFFQHSCASCHGPEGNARSFTGAKLPGRAFTDARWQSRMTDSQLVKSILKGKSAMPAFAGMLSEQEALQLVTEVVRPFGARKH
ncbi:MAG TPA: cytochrome c [Holophagaceae bacterium]|nr:cytochrome c [Holophagaceae bacterium]